MKTYIKVQVPLLVVVVVAVALMTQQQYSNLNACTSFLTHILYYILFWDQSILSNFTEGSHKI